mmetsp:Transcript_6844/g.17510  ORF Transcript_6844/g.17510 Transcript_6844/m.17510 type:complete len:150 (-) Transcript_6844:3294-3743(-)
MQGGEEVKKGTTSHTGFMGGDVQLVTKNWAVLLQDLSDDSPMKEGLVMLADDANISFSFMLSKDTVAEDWDELTLRNAVTHIKFSFTTRVMTPSMRSWLAHGPRQCANLLSGRGMWVRRQSNSSVASRCTRSMSSHSSNTCRFRRTLDL